MLEDRGWTQDDLSVIIGKSRQSISEIVSGKNGIGLETAISLGAAFGNSAQEWLHLDQLHRLSLIEKNVSDVSEMARLYQAAPIREMLKRGWIRPTESPDELKGELEAFFESSSLDEGLRFPVAAKRTMSLDHLNAAETAWCFRARHLAQSLLVEEFSPSKLNKAKLALKKLATHPKEAKQVPSVLARFGIRFVVIEPLPGAKIDGAAFWIDAGPVIALSMRFDRIDGFWFALMHEFSHIEHGDPLSVDLSLVDSAKGVIALVEDEQEKRANFEAADSLIAASELDSFIRRVGPLYPKARIIQFANRMRIHPGIIVGQLQYRKELGYMALRESLVKIRHEITATALTDGWGNSIAPGM